MKLKYISQAIRSIFWGMAIVFFTITTSYAQHNRNWLWANSAGGQGGASATAVATDGNGNVFATGTYNSTIMFGANNLVSPDSLASDFQHSMFLVKYDASGKVLWAKSGTGDNATNPSSVAVDNSGNIYATGYFKSHTLKLDNITLTNNTYNKYDIFLVKYDKDGKVLWAKSWGGANNDEANAVKTDASGNVYITGFYSSNTLPIGALSILNVATDGSKDIFVAKLDAAGKELWAKTAGGATNDVSNAITIDGSGNVYIAGGFQSGTIAFGAKTISNDTFTNTEDIFVTKYDASGNESWAISAGGGTVDIATGIVSDASGNVYITGNTTSGLLALGSSRFAGKGSEDIFIAKLNSSGSISWAENAAGINTDHATGISVDANGNLFVTGYFNSNKVNFGTTTLNLAGGYDAFVAKYNSDGSLDFVKGVGSEADEKAYAITCDNSGYVIVAGQYSSNIVGFNNPPKVYSDGVTNEMFVSKMDNKNAAGIESAWNANKHFSIYPNPSNGLVTIANDNLLNPAYNLEVYNAFGSKIYTSLNNSSNTLDMGSYANGLYFFKIQDKDGIQTIRMIKE
jgi:hypothetical protein